MKTIVLFGAGKIGRSFIAQLFSRGNYNVVFVDINPKIVDLLNSIKEYKVVVKGDKDYSIPVNNYKAIHFSEKEKIFNELATAPIIATSVGLNALPLLYPLIAESLIFRYKKTPFSPVDIIIAENLRNADLLFAENLKNFLPKNYPFEKLVGLVETSIGKMVPIMTKKDLENDPLQIFAEEYNALPLSASGFKNQLPQISGLKYITNIKAWVDRKSMIHNLGHAAAVYFGFQEKPTEKLLWKVLSNKNVFKKTRATMLQSANILLKQYPYNFTFIALEEHVDDLLSRFQNKALGDSVFRVGCDLYRKLKNDDRLAGAINFALILNQPYDLILEALVAGFHFKATDENGKLFLNDKHFHDELDHQGFEKMFQKITGFTLDLNQEIIQKAKQIYKELS